mgnify:CR=1 FL=1
MAKTLIAFFSRAGENYFNGEMKYLEVGNTEVAVGKIKRLIDADIFRIEMLSPYPADYTGCTARAKEDLNTGARPPLARTLNSIAMYDNVIIAFPNYWSTMPMAVFTFVEGLDFTGKKILPLCTNEGGSMGFSERELKRLCPTAEVARGLSIQGFRVAKTDAEIEEWLKNNGLL